MAKYGKAEVDPKDIQSGYDAKDAMQPHPPYLGDGRDKEGGRTS